VSRSPWITFKALRQLGIRAVLLNALYRLGLASGHYRRTESREQRLEDSSLRPLFVLPKPEELLAVIGDEGKAALLAEADGIVRGRVRIFGAEPAELRLALPGVLSHWSAYELNPGLLSPHYSRFSDTKFIWEPARFGWVFCLGRAYHLTLDEKYAEAFWDDFETFTTANPAYIGPNWVSGQEVALRLMAFIWAGEVFVGASSSTPGRQAALAEAVKLHALRLPPTLVYGRSQQNNHLLTEAAGLLTAGLALPDHPKASCWRALGWKWLNQGLQSQIDSSGEYAQHSTNYHRLMLQIVVWVDAILRSNNFAVLPAPVPQVQVRTVQGSRYCDRDSGRYYWPDQTIEAIRRSIDWLLNLLDSDSGRVPNLGANDGAYILPLTICPFSDFRPATHAACRAFLNHDLPRGAWDEMALWFWLPLEQSRFAKFHDLRKDSMGRIDGKDSWAYLRAAQFTNRPSHADQLHVDLWWRSLNVAQDAGTYRYNADPPWDNSLTTALVHNTVSIDGQDQFTRAGRFLYLDWFNAYQRSYDETDPAILQSMCGWHLGYRKLGIRYERTMTAYSDGHWQIRDNLLQIRKQHGKKPLTFRLHWLLPDWEWQMENNPAEMALRLISPHGPISLHVHAAGGEAPGIDLARAGVKVFHAGVSVQDPLAQFAIRGWSSPTYGVKVPALSLAVETRSANDVQFTSEFIFPP
jgi:hypothetical protein